MVIAAFHWKECRQSKGVQRQLPYLKPLYVPQVCVICDTFDAHCMFFHTHTHYACVRRRDTYRGTEEHIPLQQHLQYDDVTSLL